MILSLNEYNNLWVKTLGFPIHQIPSYYQYLQREVYFQDYLDLFGNAGITYPRTTLTIGGVTVKTVFINGLIADALSQYTVVDPTGKVGLVVDYDFPFLGHTDIGRTINYILIGEAAPAPSMPVLDATYNDSANSFFYNAKHIKPTGYLSAPMNAFDVVGNNKVNQLIALADKGFILLDLFPFAVSYDTEFRAGVNYVSFWNILCDKLYLLSNASKLNINTTIGFAPPAALFHRIVQDLIRGFIAMPVNATKTFNMRMAPNQISNAGGAIFPSIVRNYITSWNLMGVSNAYYSINSDPRYQRLIVKSKINTPVYQCECWNGSYMVPDELFIRIAFDF